MEENLNEWFHEMAAAGSESIADKKHNTRMQQIKELALIVKSRNEIEGQRDRLIRLMAEMLGLKDDPYFYEFMNG